MSTPSFLRLTPLARIALAGLVAIALAASTARRVEARPDQQETCIYYSDASHQTIVGICFISCSGVSCSGTKTAFVECSFGQSCHPPLAAGGPAGTAAFLASLAPARTPAPAK